MKELHAYSTHPKVMQEYRFDYDSGIIMLVIHLHDKWISYGARGWNGKEYKLEIYFDDDMPFFSSLMRDFDDTNYRMFNSLNKNEITVVFIPHKLM